jgi:hypothetical protein
MAKAYLVVEHIVTNAEKFEEYRIKVGPMIAKHGGRYLTKGGSHKFPEGGHSQLSMFRTDCGENGLPFLLVWPSLDNSAAIPRRDSRRR